MAPDLYRRIAPGLELGHDETGLPAVAVCYYGSGIADSLDRADRISCPVLFHFGTEDQYIPLEAAQQVCDLAEQREAWEITREFLARNLG